MIFYFSGTGNSKWVAQEIASNLSDRLYSIAEMMCDHNHDIQVEIEQGESVGLVFPIHSWGPPAIVMDFMRILQLNHYDGHYLYMVCTCGDETGHAPQIVIDGTRSKGWNWNAAWSLIMPNNYVLMTGFDTDSKEVENRKLADAAQQIKGIIEKIDSKQKEQVGYHVGRFARLKSGLIYPLFCKYAINAKPFFATDRCNGCKKCERICPTHNIKVSDKPLWGEQCTSCTACFHICPQRAIEYGRATRKKHQYIHPTIR